MNNKKFFWSLLFLPFLKANLLITSSLAMEEALERNENHAKPKTNVGNVVPDDSPSTSKEKKPQDSMAKRLKSVLKKDPKWGKYTRLFHGYRVLALPGHETPITEEDARETVREDFRIAATLGALNYVDGVLTIISCGEMSRNGYRETPDGPLLFDGSHPISPKIYQAMLSQAQIEMKSLYDQLPQRGIVYTLGSAALSYEIQLTFVNDPINGKVKMGENRGFILYTGSVNSSEVVEYVKQFESSIDGWKRSFKEGYYSLPGPKNMVEGVFPERDELSDIVPDLPWEEDRTVVSVKDVTGGRPITLAISICLDSATDLKFPIRPDIFLVPAASAPTDIQLPEKTDLVIVDSAYWRDNLEFKEKGITGGVWVSEGQNPQLEPYFKTVETEFGKYLILVASEYFYFPGEVIARMIETGELSALPYTRVRIGNGWAFMTEVREIPVSMGLEDLQHLTTQYEEKKESITIFDEKKDAHLEGMEEDWWNREYDRPDLDPMHEGDFPHERPEEGIDLHIDPLHPEFRGHK